MNRLPAYHATLPHHWCDLLAGLVKVKLALNLVWGLHSKQRELRGLKEVAIPKTNRHRSEEEQFGFIHQGLDY